MKTPKEQELLGELRDMSARLYRSGERLAVSYKKCKLIGEKPEYSEEELEVFDAFTPRFARTSDILVHKVLRLIDSLEYQEPGTIVDVFNRAEKKGILGSAYIGKQIRELRNEIAHEYAVRDTHTLFSDTLRLTPELLAAIERAITYTQKFA